MSNIYEALLRAEQERSSPKQHEGHRRDRSSLATVTALLDKPETAHIDRHPADNVDVSDRHTPAKLLGGVQVSPWKPKFEKLPTLKNRGAFTEQFRSLRSRLYEYRGFHTLKTILVSSGIPQEGKTFVAANLALSMARYKHNRVLLIDADLRKNSLHTLLGCSATPGLSSYLLGDATALEVMQRADLDAGPEAAEPSALNAVTFIAGGQGGEVAADLSGNTRFPELIRFAEPYFDWIIVDSSPVNIVSDAVNIAPFCDGVLLVARGGVTSYRVAQSAQKKLGTANLLGVVLNGASNAPHQAYYGYGVEPEQ